MISDSNGSYGGVGLSGNFNIYIVFLVALSHCH